MCWYCCTSLRGAVYFGTSVHIFVGLMLFVWWTVVTYIQGFVTHKLTEDANVLISSTLSGIYIILFITLGCLIFGGIERQSTTLLKWTALGFTMLQILVLTCMTTLYLVAPEGLHILVSIAAPDKRILFIAVFILCIIATINYLVVLYLYIRKLKSHNQDLSRDGGNQSDSINQSIRKKRITKTNLRISNPINSIQSKPSMGTPAQSTLSSLRDTQTMLIGGVRGVHGGGPESPGIYESIDRHASPPQPQQMPYFPHNPSLYSNYSTRQVYPDGIYSWGGGGSIVSRGGTRHYPHPHQRYQQPLMLRERSEEERQEDSCEWSNNASSNAYNASGMHLHYNKEASRVQMHPNSRLAQERYSVSSGVGVGGGIEPLLQWHPPPHHIQQPQNNY